MGRKRRAYVRQHEWKELYGGFKKGSQKRVKALPFRKCALSGKDWDTPVCTEDGFVFELLNVVPFVQQQHVHPITGKPLEVKDLVRLRAVRNTDGDLCCPSTGKVFNDNTHIVAIRTTGNVFAYEAVETLNIKAKYWCDLVSGEAFKRSDIITLQDPSAGGFRVLTHDGKLVQADGDDEEEEEAEAGDKAAPGVNTNDMMKRVLAQLPASEEVAGEQKKKEEAAKQNPVSRRTTGRMAASFTSTAVGVETQNERERLTDEEVRQQWYAQVKKSKKKALLRLYTNLGPLSLQLHCDLVPATCHNFLSLAKRGYYDGTVFHRSIAGFMIQGGDPSGTGRGGESAWGKEPIADEFHPLLVHDRRGVLAMANSGPNTGKSQFYLTFDECSHLDGKHSVFGLVVGGKEVLDKMEAVKTSSKDRPVQPIRIEGVTVYESPFDEEFTPQAEQGPVGVRGAHARKEAEGVAAKAAAAVEASQERRAWFSNPTGAAVPAEGSSVSRYLKKRPAEGKGRKGKKAKKAKKDKKGKKKKQVYGNFGNF